MDTKKILISWILPFTLAAAFSCSGPETSPSEITLSKTELMDKIKGGWAGQTIGCTYGGPTEFRYRGTMIQDYVPLKYDKGCVKWYYDNMPGLYDDIYMDLTFVDIFDRLGFDAPVEEFGLAFANADFLLWHANQSARYNILNGIMPPESGHWRNNPHSDDIDFQIEADFAGLMSPGMVNTAVGFADEIGHIMNYGDGWYGGVYVASMYAMAFIYDDVETIVKEAIRVIPEESRYYKCIDDVIRWHEQYPDDWKQTWYECEKKWSSDIGCPDGVFNSFNIDAVINSAYVVIGLLYGEGDFFKTMDIATRCGQDSDCNPSTAAGILGTMMGFSQIPEKWTAELKEVEDRNFAHTEISLNKAYQMSFNQALQVISMNGGSVSEDEVKILCQKPETVRLEQGFEGHWPTDVITLEKYLQEGPASFDFKGKGLTITYSMQFSGEGYNAELAVSIDGKPAEKIVLPDTYLTRKNEIFSIWDMEDTDHHVEITWLNPDPGHRLIAGQAFIYSTFPK